MRPNLAVVGFGNLGSAIVAGALRSNVIDARTTLVVETDDARRAAAASLGCPTSASLDDLRGCAQVLLAVKPQSFGEIAPRFPRQPERTVFVSVMAGIRGGTIRQALGTQHAVVRAMPNTPACVGCGMTAISLSDGARAGDESLAERIFASVGRTVRVEERLLDAVTAVSASGPAYVYLLAEIWEESALGFGFDRTTARALVRQTILGAARMLDDRTADAAALRAAVTSKGGTTAAAVAVLEERGLRAAFADALVAAERRARELAG